MTFRCFLVIIAIFQLFWPSHTFLASIEPSMGVNLGLEIGAPPSDSQPQQVQPSVFYPQALQAQPPAFYPAAPLAQPAAPYPPQYYPQPPPQGYLPGYPGYGGNPPQMPAVIQSIEKLPPYPPGAKKPKYNKKHGRSMLLDSTYGLPTISCPEIFAYQKDDAKGWYGYIALPRFTDLKEIAVEVNMTISRLVLPEDNLKLKLQSTKDEVLRGDYMRWILKFPYQDLIPKLVQITYNENIVCLEKPEFLGKGITMTNMWAKSVVKIAQDTTGPLPVFMGNKQGKLSWPWFQEVFQKIKGKTYAGTNYPEGMNAGIYGNIGGNIGANIGMGQYGVATGR